MRTWVLTAFTLAAFAANSLLARLALGEGRIDAVSYTALRLVSGAAVLLPIAYLAVRPVGAAATGQAATRVSPTRAGSWGSALALFAYALSFSLAYLSLSAGTGALILFGAVQATMIGAGLRSGERLDPFQWLGLAAALGGLVYLMLPGMTAPDPLGALLMLAAGIAWGVYSLRGVGVLAPVAATAANFLRAAPFALAAALAALGSLRADPAGVALAVISGALTSGLGYVLWYQALGGLSRTSAAAVQLLVPVMAALGGIAFLGESFSLRLGAASVLILGGVAAVVLKRQGRV